LGTSHEEHIATLLAQRLSSKGFTITPMNPRMFHIGPNIKIEIFNDGTRYTNINRRTIDKTEILLFDISTYVEMKLTALLCRTNFDARDLVDLFIIKKQTGMTFSFPNRDCDVIEHGFSERLEDIRTTTKQNLLVFQTLGQIEALPYFEFEKFTGWIHDWLSGFQ
jgi:hypothetical protein